MALIKCPDCGKEISDRAASCMFCGCPIGTAQDGVLRVQLNSWFKLIGNMSIDVTFEGEAVHLTRGYYKDFAVPADGKNHTGKIVCNKGVFGGAEFNFTLKSGESKKIFITYNDGNLINKWEYREEYFTTK